MGDTPTESDSSEQSPETAKLELPKLSLPRLGRRRKNRDATPVAREETPPVAAPEEHASVAVVTEPEPVTEQEPEPVPEPEPAPEAESVPVSAPEPPPPADLYREAPTAQHEPVVDEPVAQEPAVEEPVAEETVVDEPVADEPVEEPEAEREPFRLPALPGRLAAGLTGLIVGAFGAMLTYVSLQGCNALRGTETCGGTGLLLLVIILVVMVLFGSVLLAAWQITDARSTSFLAVGVLCVIVMLTLMQQLFSPWMFLIVPILSAAAYLLSHWVTTAFIEPKPEDGPEHDVR